MALYDELQAALVAADKAGNTQDVQTLMGELDRLKTNVKGMSARYERPEPPPNPTEGMSNLKLFGAGYGQAAPNKALGIAQILGAKTTQDVDQSKKEDAPLLRTLPGMLGNIAGNSAMAIPGMLLPGANSLLGAGIIGGTMGATDPVGSNDSRLMNTGMGAGGGVIGQGLAGALGRFVRPVQSELTPELADLAKKAEAAGIKLTPAQLTGSKPLKTIDSVMEVLPFTADKQEAIKEAQRRAYTAAVLKQMGETADKATPEVLNAGRTRIGAAFNDLSARNDVKLGDDFLNTLGKVDASVNEFSSPAIRSTVDKGLALAARGNIPGVDYQSIRSTLSKQANDAFKSGNSEVGQALKDVRNALDKAATESISPADSAAWGQARSQYGALKTIEKAGAPTSADAVAGNISPAKLAQAVMQNNKQGMLYGIGDQALPDLGRIGQAFIKDQIPNSGTPQRTFYQNLLTKPTEAFNQAIGGAGGVISKPVQAFIHSPAGQAYLTQGPMGERAKALANLLKAGTTGGAASLAVTQAQQ